MSVASQSNRFSSFGCERVKKTGEVVVEEEEEEDAVRRVKEMVEGEDGSDRW